MLKKLDSVLGADLKKSGLWGWEEIVLVNDCYTQQSPLFQAYQDHSHMGKPLVCLADVR